MTSIARAGYPRRAGAERVRPPHFSMVGWARDAASTAPAMDHGRAGKHELPLSGTRTPEPYRNAPLTTSLSAFMTYFLTVMGNVETPLRLLGALLFAFLFLSALRTPAPGRPPAGWLLRRVGLTAAFLLLLVAALNYLVNPLGMYPPRIYEPIVLHSRAEKMRLYRAARPRPEIVILGSSSSFAMSPAYIRERTGRTAFNAS